MSGYEDSISASALWEACGKLAEQAILAQEREERRPNEPEYLEGDPPVIRFWKRFGSVTLPSRRYHYAAIGVTREVYSPRGLRPKVAEQKWYVTGNNHAGHEYSWEELMDFIGEEYWDTVEVLHGLVELKPGEEI
ncbi:hypothetical protein SEA_LILYPAD_39 [Gordonia phage LilyPad]|nr:hypothetical protein SEA_LILYPAD_39 [Gordonia phage LilyPad]